MRFYLGIIMLISVIPVNHKWSIIINCTLIKVDWLSACIALRVVGAVLVVFLRRWRNPSFNRKQGPIHEELFQTLLC